MSDHLRFAPDVLRRLGEELNPSPEQGILELVRNAYDADAASCIVELNGVSKPGGTLTIRDDGVGMSVKQLRDSWLVLGRSSKNQRTRTEQFDRLQVGSKGLGRLAALRLGPVAKIRTRPLNDPGMEHSLEFDWERFESKKTVDLVDLEIVSTKTGECPGTTIEVRDLGRTFTTGDVKRVARTLVLLSSPFESTGSFEPKLLAPEFESLEELVRKGYWDQSAYELRAGIDDDGNAWAEMIDHERRGRVTKAKHADIRRGAEGDPSYEAPECSFELFVFKLGGDSSTRGRTSGVSLAALREWLKVVGGVHLYHRGLRVHPYGDPGHDWIDMNVMRTASPQERPSTNTSVGRVQVIDEKAVLQQKTDRTGFIETPAFEDLRSFAQDVLDWSARVRLADAEKRRQSEKRRARKSLETAQAQMQEAIATVPESTRGALKKAAGDLQAATHREFDTISGDLELYRTLATIGTTTAVMAHEATNPPNTIIKLVKSLRRRGKKLPNDGFESMREPLDLIESNARRIQTLVDLPRRLLDRGKRHRGTHSLNGVVEQTLAMLRPLIDDHRVTVETDLDAIEPRFIGTVAAMESVVTNLVINAVSALNSASDKGRRIRIRTIVEDKRVILDICDSGPGIKTIAIDEIFLPGRGTSPRGVGLGLTIVRDIVNDLDGTIETRANGDIGGAQFSIEIPVEGIKKS